MGITSTFVCSLFIASAYPQCHAQHMLALPTLHMQKARAPRAKSALLDALKNHSAWKGRMQDHRSS